MVKELVQLLQQKQMTIAAYESITGGLFSHYITNVPNASQVFLGSIVTYTNEIKIKVGHVSQSIITKYGVVSKETAEAMAFACQKQFNSDLAVSFTGNAGPGQLDNLPIGTGFATILFQNEATTFALTFNPNWSREQIKVATVTTIIKHLQQILEKEQGINSKKGEK
ncbi:CinA family protein [Spiroplasma melliferum]|uniref:Damage-inducible protein CinA n=3 Tax=Spiroplasma melliferum TaxID=2134 RepID=A0AAI9T3V4_SPIME|nr:CinA family protein [Spiroplasma melliferum]ELL44658.1 competence damage-inducible protein A [Spiroplasma melliferum IPMB4A]KAI92961.1 damage-inducible protein CinA [Spiroplasma melliferum KC3]QCO23866.1 putative competence-damage inducible protein [Spiroplasma melliferum]